MRRKITTTVLGAMAAFIATAIPATQDRQAGIVKGAAWPGRFPAPQFAMAPRNPRLTPELVEPWIEAQIIDAGFHGPHIPLEGRVPGPGATLLLERCSDLKLPAHVWLLGNVEWGTHPKDHGEALRSVERIAVALSAFKDLNLSVGIAYDLHEDRSDEEIAEMIELVEDILPGRLIGARAREPTQDFPGGYYGIEQFLAEGSPIDGISRKDEPFVRAMLEAAIAAGGSRPVMSEDRFRVRGRDAKDFHTGDEVLPVLRLFVQMNVSGIWGTRNPPGSINGMGSGPWSNASELRSILRPRDAASHPLRRRQQPQSPRTVGVNQGKAIADLVAGLDAEAIEIETGRGMGLLVMPGEGTTMVEWLTQLAEEIILIEVLKLDSRIDDSGAWIVTDVGARVLEVFKETKRDFRAGGHISFVQQGGEVVVGGKTVRGTVDWADSFQAGRQYLLFTRVNPDTGKLVAGASSLERVGDESFRSLRKGEFRHTTEQSPDDVLRTIRELVGRTGAGASDPDSQTDPTIEGAGQPATIN